MKPTAIGIGARPQLYEALCEGEAHGIYLEAIADNFLGAAARPRGWLKRLRARYPVVLHSVGLNLLGHAPLDESYIDGLARLADEIDAPFVSDHLCWTGAHGVHHHDLLPVPFTAPLLELAAERAAHVQSRLGRPFGIENLSSYVTFERSTMTEWEFYSGVVEQSGCRYMLDINNVYVSSQNHGFEVRDYLSTLDFTRVLQVHLAGHEVAPSGVLIDTHDRPVSDEVWSLYAEVCRQHGPLPTLIEWDDAIPPLAAVLAEVRRAEASRR